jgi:hypothetical protein
MAQRRGSQPKGRRRTYAKGCLLLILLLFVSSMSKEKGQVPPAVVDIPRPKPAADTRPAAILRSPESVPRKAESSRQEIVAPPHATPTKPHPQSEWRIFLQMTNVTLPRLVSARLSFDRLLGATVAERVAIESSLKKSGELELITNGTAALVREKWDGSRFVEIVGGKFNGKRGWVEERYVREAPPPSIVEQARRDHVDVAARRKRHAAESLRNLERIMAPIPGLDFPIAPSAGRAEGGFGGFSMAAHTSAVPSPSRARHVGIGWPGRDTATNIAEFGV